MTLSFFSSAAPPAASVSAGIATTAATIDVQSRRDGVSDGNLLSRRGQVVLREVSWSELEGSLASFAELLRVTVDEGASLGFLPPLTFEQARNYWLSLRADLQSGSRLLFAAYAGGRVVGTGQLVFPMWPNMPHKAEIQKLLVAAAARGQGLGRSLIATLHDAARQRGRSLLTLSTRRGGRAEALYKSLGYQELGVMPRSTVGPAGERYDSVFLYQELADLGRRDLKASRAGVFEHRFEPASAAC